MNLNAGAPAVSCQPWADCGGLTAVASFCRFSSSPSALATAKARHTGALTGPDGRAAQKVTRARSASRDQIVCRRKRTVFTGFFVVMGAAQFAQRREN
jgi:hypothetical protein